MKFEWDEAKNRANIAKHNLSFHEAAKAFRDKNAIYAPDKLHSTKNEERLFCIGKIAGDVATVVFTVRKDKIRIISAGYYRKERSRYEKRNKK